MKLEILKEDIDRAISSASKVSNKNLSLPVLGCVVVSAQNEHVIVRATNLDVSVEIPVKAKILEEGSVAVPAQIFSQTIATSTDTKITLFEKDNVLVVGGDHGDAKLKTLDVSEFPTLSYVKEGQGVAVSVPTKEVTKALKTVSFAASSSGMRPELSSIYLTLQEGVLITAATDSFRLAEAWVPVKTKQAIDPVLIPARNVQDILRVISEGDTTEIRVGENQCTFISGGAQITSRTIDGAFPEYKAIIPTAFVATTTMLTEDAVRAFRKVSVFSDSFGRVEIQNTPSKKQLLLGATNTQVGETQEAVDAVMEGEDVSMNFNIRYITDALSVLSSDSVVFKIAGEGKPVVIEESPNSGFMCLVMPMNK
ncbi:DNA polymerase III subunit beta [Candidatus Kaiserbacteria bacterium CG10_big_fil_rev_8_21_14_0_10_45_20]|uniref:Beta sliding clamp n=1 Tax=Candidatus Kaiserbacteria bacterium CG10_big_fil_rev_8_21_14_0_10_45_20 TaxID=1974607 RepID=A0A2H0UF84_9BACT|nr:MAG: DNA polymerase III subunit beta [Candidatus Kaiserbacteria bacterium CG10_big_fil_rev_8_21_14_0_10_45_20]